MARFIGLAVQTDILVNVPVGTAPARVTFFRPDDLVSCVAVHSPTEPESLTVQVQRTDSRCAELVLGRVLRLAHEGAVGDTEWDITTIEDTSSADVLTITATPILLRLARVVYMGTDATTGAAAPDWTGVELTATEWLNALVIPQLAAAGMAFELGTVDNTTARFTMDGDWTSLLEIVRAIAEPGRAGAEVQLTPGGDYGYVLDLRTAIGSSSATVRVRTAVNLLELKRERSLTEVATRLFPRGSTDSVATRTMSDHLWRIASVVSGTVLALEDIQGGDGPILYDDQLNGLYLAVFNSPTFASTIVTDSVAATQRVTIGSTAGMTAGEWVRFFAGSGENGARVTSLTHPTLVDHPADGGFGDRALILDRPAVVADCNLVPNPMLRDWTVAADPPDDWEEFAETPAAVVFSQELADGPATGVPAFRVVASGISDPDRMFGEYTGTAEGPALEIRAPLCYPWESATAGRRTYVATAWIKVVAAASPCTVSIGIRQVGGSINTIDIGTWTAGTDDQDTWIRYESAATDVGLGWAAGGQYIVWTVGTSDTPNVSETAGAWQGEWDVATAYAANDWVSYDGECYRCTIAPSTGDTPPGTDWTIASPTPSNRVAPNFEMLASAVTLSESATAIADREYSGGTVLWQEANAELPNVVNAIKGYDLTVADLAADDATTYSTLAFTAGGTVEVTDTDLGVSTSLRLVEYTRDYLRPMQSGIRVGNAPDRMTRLTDSLRPNGVFG